MVILTLLVVNVTKKHLSPLRVNRCFSCSDDVINITLAFFDKYSPIFSAIFQAFCIYHTDYEKVCYG